MSTHKIYLTDADQLTTTATVREVFTTEEGAHLVRLDRTLFHPSGGGQPADQGTLGGQRVLHVAHAPDGDVDHHVEALDGLTPGAEVTLAVAAAPRLLNTRAHTAGHAIAHAVEALCPDLKAVGGHHWPDQARVEFSGPAQDDYGALQRQLQARLQADLDADLPVRVLLGQDSLRRIAIGDYAPVPCGGTHAPSLAALDEVQVTRVRRKSGRIRVSYAVG